MFEKILGLKAQGRSVVYTTHYMEEAERLCDRVGVIDHGRFLAMGSVDSLIEQHGGKSVVTAHRSGEDVRIEVTRTDDRSLFDPVVSLVGPDGRIMQRLEQSDDNLNGTLDATIKTTVEETGDYLVVVEGHRSYGEYKVMLSKSTNELLSFKVSETAD